MSQTTPRQTVYNIAAGYKAATGDTDELNYGNIADKVTKALNDEYQYPSHWPDIRTNDTDAIVLLVSDINPTVNFIVQGGSNNVRLTIDWGDGTIENDLPTNTTNTYKGVSVARTYHARHTYETTGNEDCYNTYVIKINKYTSTGSINLFRGWGQDGDELKQSWLALKINIDTITSLIYLVHAHNQGTNYCTNPYIEYVDISACNRATSLDYAFAECYRLQKLILPEVMNSLTTMIGTCRRCSMLKELVIPTAPSLTTVNTVAVYCSSLKQVVWKGDSYPELYNFGSAFAYTPIEYFKFPATLNTNSTRSGTFSSTFYFDGALKEIIFPTNADWGNNITAMASFVNNIGAQILDFSNMSLPAATALNAMCNSTNVEILKFPKAPVADTTSSGNLFSSSNTIMEEIYFPTEYGSISHPQQTWDLASFRNLKVLSANCGVNLQKLTCRGYSAAVRGSLHTVILPPNSTFGGTSPQIDFSNQALTHEELVDLLTYLGTLGLTRKTVKLTGCAGASELTAAEKALATGWTVVTS